MWFSSPLLSSLWGPTVGIGDFSFLFQQQSEEVEAHGLVVRVVESQSMDHGFEFQTSWCVCLGVKHLSSTWILQMVMANFCWLLYYNLPPLFPPASKQLTWDGQLSHSGGEPIWHWNWGTSPYGPSMAQEATNNSNNNWRSLINAYYKSGGKWLNTLLITGLNTVKMVLKNMVYVHWTGSWKFAFPMTFHGLHVMHV